MKGDLLREATQALRDESQEVEAPAELSRARIMQSLHQRRRRRSTRLALFVPLAAICIGSTAWAAATQRLPKLWQAMVELTSGSSEAPAEPAPVKPIAKAVNRPKQITAPEPAAAPTPAPEPSELAREPRAAVAEAREPRAAVAEAREPRAAAPGARDVRPAPAVADAPNASRSADGVASEARSKPDPTDSLYRAAHELHFGARDPVRALQAWDAYLAAAPNGRLAIEARYNRALTLLRLGRSSEARAALEPFARGAYGEYRRAEAEALIGAVDAGSPEP